jgi:hypothetical protein
MDLPGELQGLERALRREGHRDAARELQAIRRDLVLMAQPPSRLARLASRLATRTRPHWERLRRELAETGEASRLFGRAAQDGPESLSPAEQERLEAQIVDVLKTIPSLALFIGLFFVPLPGAQAMTPLFLSRFGLLPSAWRDGYALHGLGTLARRLELGGPQHAAVVGRLRALRAELAAHVPQRAALGAALRTHPDHVLLFDDDFDGRLSPVELATAWEVLLRVREEATRSAERPGWYAFVSGEVLGPFRLAELDAPRFRDVALVSFGAGSAAWAPLRLVLRPAVPVGT